ncbi:phage integrase SAM-like domain-containing protein [uncultured Limosilactobacillus sp.]|uniref:phage integrase SAM-like domain-containing protein n=1 Tax=uncultured Limosilactobacillus sp. TaxID=2837629 RepID=UPI0025CE14AC|nr:phage integrase SAM-like domain-containing protein [uncultured Limosilactobacillus sp.]
MSVSIEKLKPTKTRGTRYRARFRGYYRGDDLELHQFERTQTFDKKSDAEAWLLEKQQEKAQGVDKRSTKITWIFDHFYALSKAPYLRDNTKRSWKLARKIFTDYFGEDRTVDSITSDDYQAFMNHCDNHYSHTTLLGVSQKLAEVFTYAVEHRYINRSPILSSLRIRGSKARTVQYLNLEQIKTLLDYIHSHRMRRRSGLAQEAGT